MVASYFFRRPIRIATANRGICRVERELHPSCHHHVRFKSELYADIERRSKTFADASDTSHVKVRPIKAYQTPAPYTALPVNEASLGPNKSVTGVHNISKEPERLFLRHQTLEAPVSCDDYVCRSQRTGLTIELRKSQDTSL